MKTIPVTASGLRAIVPVEATAHAARERPHQPVGRVGEAQALEQLVGPRADHRARQVVEAADHLEVGARGEQVVDGGLLAGEAELRAHDGRIGDDVVPGDRRAALGRAQQRGEDAHRRGLAGAVVAEQAEHRALGDVEVDVAQLKKGFRAGLRAIAIATRANFERHPWIVGAMRPRPRAIPGPNSLRHFDQSVGAVAETGVDVKTQMEIVALVDDYVFGFALRASIAAFEEREEEAEPGWLRAVFDYMWGELETGAYPNARRLVDVNREAGGRDEDLAAMALDEDRFERGLDRLLDGIEVELERKAPTRRRGR